MHPESWPYYNKRHTSREKAGGFILAKTFRDLKADPELVAAEFPEIHAALQEIPGRFRQAYQALTGSVVLIWPQIRIQSALPSLWQDFMAARKGDRDAATHLSKRFTTSKELNPDILADAVLEVLTSIGNIGDALPVYLYKDGRSVPLRDTNGKLKDFTPDIRFLDEVWEWLEDQAMAEAVDCLRKGKPYEARVRFSEEPSEENPFPLSRPKKSRRGRPPDSPIYNKPEFLELYPTAIKTCQEREGLKRRRPTNKQVADEMMISEGLLLSYKRKYLK
jgi:hypothetical protein